MFDFDTALHAAEFAVFGDKALFRLPSGDVELDVVLRDAEKERDINGQAKVADHSHLLDVLAADVSAHGIAIRQTVTVRGADYQLIAPCLEEEADGIVVFKARRYS